MPALRDLQTAFIQDVLEGGRKSLSCLHPQGPLAPEQRLQIYRNNTFLILTDNLKASFPATAALGSEAFFRYAAHAFIKAHPPASGDMNGYGAAFPGFLTNAGLVKAHPYLADVAAVEWLRHECYMAADKGASVLHPSVRLFASAWPVLKLWRLGCGEIAPEDVDLSSGGENLVIFRRKTGVEMWGVDADVLRLVTALRDGQDFEMPEGFDLAFHLGNFQAAGLVQAPVSALPSDDSNHAQEKTR